MCLSSQATFALHGFQATGIHPLQREVISNEKLNAGVAFRKPPTQDRLSTTPSSTAHAITPPPLILKGNCRSCGFAFAPMRAHITLHFTKVLQARKHNTPCQRKKRVKLTYYGEALTSDEIVARLESQKRGPKSPSMHDSDDDDAFSSHDEVQL